MSDFRTNPPYAYHYMNGVMRLIFHPATSKQQIKKKKTIFICICDLIPNREKIENHTRDTKRDINFKCENTPQLIAGVLF